MKKPNIVKVEDLGTLKARPSFMRNPFDRITEYFNPIKAKERYAARAQIEFTSCLYGDKSPFNAASSTEGAFRNWITSTRTPDEEYLYDRQKLVERSRDQFKNNPIAKSAILTKLTSIIGSGLKLQCRLNRDVLKLTDEEAEAWEDKTEQLFDQWASHTDADALRRENFYELQSLAMLTYMQSGEVFATTPLIDRPGTICRLRINLVEPDLVSTPNGMIEQDGLYSGIRIGTSGEPTTYYFKKPQNNPFSMEPEVWTAVPAFGNKTGRQNVIHVYKQERVGQRRGVPILTPVITCLRQIGEYTDAELNAALVASYFTVFIKSSNDGVFNSITGQSDNTSTPELKKGGVARLSPDESIDIASSNRPNALFEPFVESILKQVGMGLNIPYEVLIKSFTSSYSASRAALMEAWRCWIVERGWFIDKFNQPIYEEWLSEMVSTGKIDAPGFFDDVRIRRAYCSSEWQGPVPVPIDPVKEINAAQSRMQCNISTLAEETQNLTGKDYKSNLVQIAKEQTAKEELGLISTAYQIDLTQKQNVENGGTNA